MTLVHLVVPPSMSFLHSKCGSWHMWDLGAQGGSAKASARNNAPGLCDTRLAEACPLKLRNIVKYREEDVPKVAIWEVCAPKMRLVEAQAPTGSIATPKTPPGSHPTSRVSQHVLFTLQLRLRWV